MSEDKSNEAKLIAKKLFVDESTYRERLEQTLDRIAEYIKIVSEDGRILFRRDKLTIRDMAFLMLVGKYLFVKAGHGTGEKVSLREISETIRKPVTSISGPIKELLDQNFVARVGEGEY